MTTSNSQFSRAVAAWFREGAKAHKALYNAPRDTRKLRLNNNTDLIKLVACAMMLLDHTGKMLFAGAYQFVLPGVLSPLSRSLNILRVFGRLAMPMFCYCIAVGGAYSRNVWKYALRLLLLAVIVQPLYMEAMGHKTIGAFDWAANFYRADSIYQYYYTGKLNILFSLFLGVMLLGSIRGKAYVLSALIAVIVWRYQGSLDYGWKLIGLIVLFYAFLDRPFASFAAVFLFMLDWALPSLIQRGSISGNSQVYALMALPLIYMPLKRRLRLPKYVFYVFYPAHLLVIYLVLRFK